MSNADKQPSSIAGRFVNIAYVSGIILFLNILANKNGFLPLFFIGGFFGSIWVGEKIAEWYMKKSPSVSQINKIGWSNMVTWLIPIIGIAMSTATFHVAEKYPMQKNKLIVLGITGFVMSLINIGINLYLI